MAISNKLTSALEDEKAKKSKLESQMEVLMEDLWKYKDEQRRSVVSKSVNCSFKAYLGSTYCIKCKQIIFTISLWYVFYFLVLSTALPFGFFLIVWCKYSRTSLRRRLS